MEFRYLGRSGLQVSEIAYGNWITHGSQVEEDAAKACVRAALDAGITTFDTADVYAATRAESVLGEALAGRAPRGAGDLHQGLLADRARRHNDRGLSRKHIMESIDGSLRRLRHRLRRPLPGAPLRLRDAAGGDDARLRRPRAAGKVLYVGVSEWRAEQIRAAAALARELRVPLVSNQPQYSMLWRVIEAEVVPASRAGGHRPDRVVADRAGRADRQVPPRPGAAGRLARHRRERRRRLHDAAG